MKKITKHAKWRSIQLLNAIKRKQLRELRKREHQEQRRKIKENRKNTLSKQLLTTLLLIAPRVFNIENKITRGIVLNFLHSLRQSFAQPDINRIIIDLTDTDSFVADATLLFHAELSRLKEMRQNTIAIEYKQPINDKASEVLHQIGFYEICGRHPHKRSAHKYDDVVHWRVATGSVVNNEICAPAIEKYEGQLAEPLLEGLFRGLGEAMTNTKHHAYEDGIRDDGLNYNPGSKSWWMFSQEKDDHLSVVFCDLGIGIPRTLPLKKPNLYKRLITLGKAGKDSEYIKIAIKEKLSRTNQPERGKGLGDIVQAITKENSGTVKIISNHGVFIKDRTGTVTRDLKESILGTLIYWRVPLTNGFDSGKENN